MSGHHPASPPQTEKSLHPSRRDVIGGAIAAVAVANASARPAMANIGTRNDENELTWLPAWRLREMIGARQISPVEVVNHFLSRIEKLNPVLGAFNFVDGDGARTAARAAEAAVMTGQTLGPLHGIPVSFKDWIMVRGAPFPLGRNREGTHYGLRSPSDTRMATYDDAVVERIRAAGGIAIGKTVVAGPPRSPGAANPWDVSRTAGASSSGASSATAAGLGPVAISTDGGGSIRLPAAYSGVVGLHPTIGRVPRYSALSDGLYDSIESSWSATVGPTTRDVRDTATLMQVMGGPDWRTLHSFGGALPDYVSGLNNGARGMRMAWTSDYGFASVYFDENSEEVIGKVRNAAFGLQRIGASVEDSDFKIADPSEIFISLLASLQRAIGRNSFGDYRPPLDNDAAFLAREKLAREYLKLFERYDILLSATTPIIAPTRTKWTDWLKSPEFVSSYTCLTAQFNTIGFPAISVPCGFVHGMPVSLQIVGRPDDDARILQVAQAFQQAFPQASHPIALS